MLEAWSQCERRAWLMAHAPERARVASGLGSFMVAQRADVRRLIDGGGAGVPAPPRPRSAAPFGAVAGPGTDVVFEARLERLVARGPGDRPYRVRGRVDLFERDPGGWHASVLTVGAHVRDHHVRRLALAVLTAEAEGRHVARTSVMYVDRRRSGDGPPLRSVDVSSRVEAERRHVPARLRAAAASLAAPSEPATAPGGHCRRPRNCLFLDHCRAQLGGRSVDQVWGLRPDTRRALRSAGWARVDRVPDDAPALTATERRALSDGRDDTVRLRRNALRSALAQLRPPVAYLDIEFATPAVPWVAGTVPFEALPFQFSLHVESTDGALDHAEVLVLEPQTDPRPPLAGALAGALDGVGSIVVYDAASENRLLAGLAAFEPSLGGARERLWDLQAVVRHGVSHPGFEARWDLKRVADTLVSDSYLGVTLVDGLAAQASWRRLLRQRDPALEEELRRYCTADSRAMADIVAVLRRWLRPETPPT